jgi:hypothetical protein
MKLPRALLLFGFVFLISCKDRDSVSTDLTLDTPNFDFPVGERRVILKEFSKVGTQSTSTSSAIGVFTVEKDTLFHETNAKIISSQEFEYQLDSTYEYQSRYLLVNEGNQLNVYQFKTDGSNAFLFNLFKLSAVDTTVFSDKMTVIEYPLFLGKTWDIRAPADSTSGMILKKEFVRLDTLVFNAKPMQCEVFVLHSFIDLTTWVSKIGLLKAEIDYSQADETDSAGNFLGTFTSHDKYELLKLNPTDAEIESYKVKYKTQPRQ